MVFTSSEMRGARTFCQRNIYEVAAGLVASSADWLGAALRNMREVNRVNSPGVSCDFLVGKHVVPKEQMGSVNINSIRTSPQ
jgi:hypothetical protein